MKKLLVIILIISVIAGAGYYWLSSQQETVIDTDGNVVPGTSIFSPFNRSGTIDQTPEPSTDNTNTEEPIITVDTGPYNPPKLRQLSSTPVAGVSASSTATTSVVRFMDRGTGHVYEADNVSEEIIKISNTTLPKIYETYWNKNLTALVSRYLRDETDTITNFYAELRSTGTSTTETPFEIKGSYLSPNINEIAVSPLGDKIFTWNIESGRGVGYISSFDEKNKTKVADTPLRQVNVEWPETNTITINTKASAVSNGFLYSIDTRNGVMNRVLGDIRGLSSKTSKDNTKVLYSSSNGNSILSYLFNKNDSSIQETVFRTLADKCVWSTLRKNELYCAVPTEIPSASYPDDWYKGSVSFLDQIWHLDTTTGEVHLLANLLSLSNNLIDATSLTLDPKEEILTFINKRDLSLWMLDLNQ